MSPIVSFEVPDVSCGHCARAITEAVHEVDAAAQVHVDLGAKRVAIESAQASAEQLEAAIREAGYSPQAA